nr:immunoglobulin heavy chain junction region [Mus musculus]NSM09431.1 immunoglobulin heavy chain junction region [Mus musculus]
CTGARGSRFAYW